VDHVYYSGSGTVTLPDTIENVTLTGGNANALGNLLGNTINGGDGDNVLQGMGGDDRIRSGSGNDRVEGGTGHDQVYGDAGKDRVYGGAGNDKVNGSSGNDWVYGGAGNDMLYGSSGRDRFVFDSKPSKNNVDKVVDFNAVDDGFYLDHTVFTKLGRSSDQWVKIEADMFVNGTRAQDAEDRIIYDRDTGSLYYDRDGTGSAAQVKFATLMNKAKLSYHDFLVI
jgi:Ca2+-binding RTX toxin-like protein